MMVFFLPRFGVDQSDEGVGTAIKRREVVHDRRRDHQFSTLIVDGHSRLYRDFAFGAAANFQSLHHSPSMQQTVVTPPHLDVIGLLGQKILLAQELVIEVMGPLDRHNPLL
jgi:hypothetical protein